MGWASPPPSLLGALLLLFCCSVVWALDTCSSTSVLIVDETPFNIPAFDLPTSVDAPSRCSCAAQCEGNPDCVFFTFTAPRTCSLKRPAPVADAVTIFKAAPAVLRFNGEATAGILTSSLDVTEAQCITDCQTSLICNFVVYYSSSSLCRLFSGAVDLTTNVGLRIGELNPITTTASQSSSSTVSESSATAGPTETQPTETTAGPEITEGPLTGVPATFITSGTLTLNTTRRPPAVITVDPTQAAAALAEAASTANRGVLIGLGMVGAVIGLLFIGAMVAYFRSMSRRTRPDPTKPSGPVLKDPGESKTMTRTMVRPDMSTMRYGNGSTAQFSQESSYNGGVGTIHNGSYGAGAASQYSQQPAAGAYDTMRGPGTMNPGASATPYASSIAPTTMQRGPQQYPTLSAYHQGYSEPQQQDEEQKVYTVEQYLASGWTMEQIESFKPPLHPSSPSSR